MSNLREKLTAAKKEPLWIDKMLTYHKHGLPIHDTPATVRVKTVDELEELLYLVKDDPDFTGISDDTDVMKILLHELGHVVKADELLPGRILNLDYGGTVVDSLSSDKFGITAFAEIEFDQSGLTPEEIAAIKIQILNGLEQDPNYAMSSPLDEIQIERISNG